MLVPSHPPRWSNICWRSFRSFRPRGNSSCHSTCAMISLGYQLVSVMNVVFTQYTIDINRPSPNSPEMSGVYTFVGFACFTPWKNILQRRNGGPDEPRGTDRSPAGSLPISTHFPWNDLGWTRASTLVSVFPFSWGLPSKPVVVQSNMIHFWCFWGPPCWNKSPACPKLPAETPARAAQQKLIRVLRT